MLRTTRSIRQGRRRRPANWQDDREQKLAVFVSIKFGKTTKSSKQSSSRPDATVCTTPTTTTPTTTTTTAITKTSGHRCARVGSRYRTISVDYSYSKLQVSGTNVDIRLFDQIVCASLVLRDRAIVYDATSGTNSVGQREEKTRTLGYTHYLEFISLFE